MRADGVLQRERDSVLASHPNGAQVRLDDALAHHRALQAGRRFHVTTERALRDGSTLLQPRAGVTTLRGQSRMLQRLADEGGADVLPLTVDSSTRQLDFARADAAWRTAEAEGDDHALNGFPAVSAGVGACRALVEACDRPIQVRHGAPDARLLAEITLAGGCTAFEGGGISYCIPYSKTTPLATALEHWRYVDRLCGLYAAHGVVIEREAFGALTGILVPPSIAIACSVIELLLAATEGVAAFALGIGQGGEIVQDVAAVRALRRLGHEYLRRRGLAGRTLVSTVFYQWMGPFPEDAPSADAVIALGAVTAAAARPTRMITKTRQEAHGVPDVEANIAGLRLCRALGNALSARRFVDEAAVREEQRWIEREARCLLDNVLALAGAEPLADGAVAAFACGQLDVPFAPSHAAKGWVRPARDPHRAVRFADPGALPFDAETVARNDHQLYGSDRLAHRADPIAELARLVADLDPEAAVAAPAPGVRTIEPQRQGRT
jgi:methylaspartate mutase epsilon subunit